MFRLWFYAAVWTTLQKEEGNGGKLERDSINKEYLYVDDKVNKKTHEFYNCEGYTYVYVEKITLKKYKKNIELQGNTVESKIKKII